MHILGLVLILVSAAAAYPPEDRPWQAPTASDKRSACPLLNSLANHGFIPRSGRNITAPALFTALSSSINLDPAAAEFPASAALSLSTTGNPDTFDLDDIDKHGVIEHDASLSRADVFWGGDASRFNWTVWNETKSFFEGETISVAEAAKAREARINTSKRTNPQYSLTEGDLQASFFETAFYLLVFGDGNEAKTGWVTTFFEQERFPYTEGFSGVAQPITIEKLSDVSLKLGAVM